MNHPKNMTLPSSFWIRNLHIQVIFPWIRSPFQPNNCRIFHINDSYFIRPEQISFGQFVCQTSPKMTFSIPMKFCMSLAGDGLLDVREYNLIERIFWIVSKLFRMSYPISLDVRSPSNVKRHIRIDAVHHDVCRKQYEKIVLNPVKKSFCFYQNWSIQWKRELYDKYDDLKTSVV